MPRAGGRVASSDYLVGHTLVVDGGWAGALTPD
jgi:hypothetical protein